MKGADGSWRSLKDPTCFTSCAASRDSCRLFCRHTSTRRSSSSADQEIRLKNAMKELSRTILCVAEELHSRFLSWEKEAETLTAANYSPRQCERTPLILPLMEANAIDGRPSPDSYNIHQNGKRCLSEQRKRESVGGEGRAQ